MAPVRDQQIEELKEYFDVDDVIVVNSGTSALIATIMSMDLSPKSEIITTPFTFISTSNSILLGNGKPVFVDIKSDSKLIDENQIINYFSEMLLQKRFLDNRISFQTFFE